MTSRRVVLSENELPSKWYNLQADLPTPLPPVLHPGTKEPIGPADLQPLFADELIAQEVSTERWIEIPQEIRDVLAMWRPTPLVRARGLEKALKTPARIYFKDESHSPAGSHKVNTAVAQAYYNAAQGIHRGRGRMAPAHQLRRPVGELARVGHLAEEHEIGRLLEARASHQVADRVAAVQQLALATVDVRDGGVPGDEALEAASVRLLGGDLASTDQGPDLLSAKRRSGGPT